MCVYLCLSECLSVCVCVCMGCICKCAFASGEEKHKLTMREESGAFCVCSSSCMYAGTHTVHPSANPLQRGLDSKTDNYTGKVCLASKTSSRLPDTPRYTPFQDLGSLIIIIIIIIIINCIPTALLRVLKVLYFSSVHFIPPPILLDNPLLSIDH